MLYGNNSSRSFLEYSDDEYRPMNGWKENNFFPDNEYSREF